jgi:hypothetical protein
MEQNPTPTTPITKPRAQHEWRAIVEAWKASGEKQASFCRTRGINRRAFVNWKTKIYPSTPPRRATFVPVTFKPASVHPVALGAEPSLAIVTERGCRIEVRGILEARLLRQVLEFVREVRR